MFFNLIIFILIFSTQAFADATNHFAGYNSASGIDQFQTVEVNGNVGIGTTITSSTLSIFGQPGSITLNSSTGVDIYTELMLHLNNSAIDASQNNYSITNTNVTFSNSSPEFGGTYYGVFGASSVLALPSNTFNFGSGNFTIDLWINPTSLSGTNEGVFQHYDGGNNEVLFYLNSDGSLQFIDYESSYQINFSTAAGAIITGSWQHVALVRNGTNFTIYVNGVSKATTTSSHTLVSITSSPHIGYVYGSSNYINGSVSEYRISNIARWTSNFTPSTTPYGVPDSQITLQDTSAQKSKIWIDSYDSDKFKIDDATATRLTIAAGNVGIGTINPIALLDVTGPVRIQTGLITNGAAPTIGTGPGDCGTSPSVVGNDISGTITVGSGANGGQCTVTFSAAKSSTPNCICQNSTTANLTRAANQSTTSFACTGTLTAGDKLVYWCPQ